MSKRTVIEILMTDIDIPEVVVCSKKGKCGAIGSSCSCEMGWNACTYDFNGSDYL